MMKRTYKKYAFFISLLMTFYLHGDVFDGYTLFTPTPVGDQEGTETYLINNDFEILNSWYHDYGPASMPYLLPDSSIIYKNSNSI